MEVKEEEAKICRLCGQSDNICIDVFSEDGTSRLLCFKIHSKINILIDERDLLPKTICVHCVGKLEFVCDFQEECLRTQELLRDRYNLPQLSDVDELDKHDHRSVPGTSTINNNDSDKDLNRAETTQPQLEEEEISIEFGKHEIDHHQSKSAAVLNELPISHETPILTTLQNVPFPQEFANSQEILRNQHPVQSPSIQQRTEILNRDGMRTEVVHETTTHDRNILNSEEDILQVHDVLQSRDVYQALPNSPSTPIIRSIKKVVNEETKSNNPPAPNTCVRWLRGRNELEIKCTKSSSSSSSSSPAERTRKSRSQSTRSSPLQIADKTSNGQRNMIQIATSTLNKLLNIIAETCEVEVSVRESLNTDNNSEDISFLIELRSKENSNVNVLAKVFPDQGSCLVDPAIVAHLKEQSNPEMSEILKVIDAKSQKKGGLSALENIEDEESQGPLRNPEELFRMDGEEIHVDENVEQVTINNQMSYACRLCRKIYERRDKCTVHVKTHLGIKQYLCIVCQAKFVCKSDVMKHIRCSHTNPRPISCPKCPKRFRSKFDLAEHTNVHKGIKPYRCSDCDQTYHHKVSLQMHVKSHLPPQNLACEYCGKVFPYRTRLLSHVGSVHMKNRRNFRCHFCYNLYSSLSVLNDHIKTRHATTFTCETCNKTFKVASKYKAHVHQHTNPKPYVCTVCDNRYASKAFLNEHLLKHQGLRKHVCQKCGARFAQASHLAAHRHVHGEKTHVCPECGKKFNRRDNMKVHRKRHFENVKKTGSIKQEEEEEENDRNEK